VTWIFRDAKVPSDEVMQRIFRQQLDNVVRGHPCYRHHVLILHAALMKLAKNKVPIGVEWPNALVNYESDADFPKELESFSDWIHSYPANYMQSFGWTDPKVLQTSLFNELSASWTLFRSLEYSDTPNWYKPSEDLVYSLAATNLSGVYAEDIHMPFPAIFLELPRGVLRGSTVRGMHDILCIGVAIGNINPTRDVDRRLLTESAECANVPLDEVLGRDLRLLLIHEPLPGDQGMDDVSTHTAHIRFNRDDVPLHELIISSAEPRGPDQYRTEFFGVPVVPVQADRAIFNLVIGFLLYLQSTQDLTKVPVRVPRSKRGVKHSVARLLTANSWLVGTRVRLDPRIKDAVREGWTTGHRHKTVVPGHAQRYRCGPHDDWHYEIRFKAPYVKSGDGPILGHSYVQGGAR
jgi:hypothetical protein